MRHFKASFENRNVGSLHLPARFIRKIIPPRPAVTTLVYLSRSGKIVRHGESDLSLIRTRENKFYLQRVLENGETIRWLAPGLEHLKNVTNFETYSLSEIDENGGIIIPADVMPSAPHEPPSFFDAVYFISRMVATKKFTRKDRRDWHRRLFSHWRESPEKFVTHSIGTYGIVFLILLWFVVRGFHSIKNNRPFWDVDVYKPEKVDNQVDPWKRLKRFSEMHPEHEGLDMTVTLMSPGQSHLSSSRAELRESDFTDPHYHSELWWKIRHCRYYGHWPKGIADE